MIVMRRFNPLISGMIEEPTGEYVLLDEVLELLNLLNSQLTHLDVDEIITRTLNQLNSQQENSSTFLEGSSVNCHPADIPICCNEKTFCVCRKCGKVIR